MSYIPPMLMNTGSIMHTLSAAYESRNFVVARSFMPVAKFQGDTTQTLADGSLNVDPVQTDKTATARLATTTNVDGTGNSSGKPLEIRVKRNAITAEITEYAVFNADNSVPGGAAANPWDGTLNTGARYRVNIGSGQIFVNNQNNFDSLDVDSDGTYESAVNGTGTGAVVGLLEFKPLEGAALAMLQQTSSELSTVIQSLASLIRSRGETERSILSTIR